MVAIRPERLHIRHPALVTVVKKDACLHGGASTVVDGHILNANLVDLRRPPDLRCLTRPPVVHVQTRGNRHRAAADPGYRYQLLLAVRCAADDPSIVIPGATLLADVGYVANENAASVHCVVGLVQDYDLANRQIGCAVQRDLRCSPSVAPGPAARVAATRLNRSAAVKVARGVGDADIAAIAVAAIAARELQNRLLGSGAAQRDVAVPVESDTRCQRVGSRVQENYLPARTGCDRAVDLCRGCARVQGRADRRTARDTTRHARLAPINRAAGINDSRPGLPISRS